MKVKVIDIHTKASIELECDSITTDKECYTLTNTDRSEPHIPRLILVAIFPVHQFYILRNANEIQCSPAS